MVSRVHRLGLCSTSIPTPRRIAFIDWYAKKVDTMRSLFEHLDTPPVIRAFIATDPTRPDQTRPDPTRPDQTRSDLDQTRPDPTRPDQAHMCVCVCVCVGIVLSPIGNETLNISKF